MTKQVHIVGISPRTGTTLMSELMIHCFDFDGYADHELSLYYEPSTAVERLCTKKPSDLRLSARALRWRSNLWVICMVRDPRDVIVSRHQKSPDLYWSNLGIINRRLPFLRRARAHDRFLIVRYEDLVTEPDTVQDILSFKIPFLRKTADFSRFHEVVRPTEGSVVAMNGIRPISTQSIGRWRSELPRLKAQIDKFGGMNFLLRQLGYEEDDEWLKILESVLPDNGKGYFEDNSMPLTQRWIREARESYLLWRQLFGRPLKADILSRNAEPPSSRS